MILFLSQLIELSSYLTNTHHATRIFFLLWVRPLAARDATKFHFQDVDQQAVNQ